MLGFAADVIAIKARAHKPRCAKIFRSICTMMPSTEKLNDGNSFVLLSFVRRSLPFHRRCPEPDVSAIGILYPA